MNDSTLKYFFQEQNRWMATLDYIQQQSAELKNSLVYVFDNPISREVLLQLEIFQNQFLQKDILILLLRGELIAQKELLLTKNVENNFCQDLIEQQEKLRADMERVEKDFSSLKFNFNRLMSSCVWVS